MSSILFNLTCLLLLYISLHGCHARKLVPTFSKELHKKSHLQNQEDNRIWKDELHSKERKPSLKAAIATEVRNGGKISSSWNVPHEKEGDKHPGFNLDYSPPKTHPPVHN